MSVANCPRCGKVFLKMGAPICEQCEKEEEVMFEEVRKFIDEHKEATVEEICEGTGVTVNKLMKYMRDGKLEAVTKADGSGLLHCESCNKPITKGRYCDSCIVRLNTEITDMFDAEAIAKARGNQPKMHTRRDK